MHLRQPEHFALSFVLVLSGILTVLLGLTQDAQENHTWLDEQANGDPLSKIVTTDTEVKNNCRIYFPTEQTVEASKGGKGVSLLSTFP